MHPLCSVIQMNGMCTADDLDVNNCNKKTWLAECNISYSGVTLLDVYLTNYDTSVTFDHGEIITIGSPLTVIVR